MKLFLKLVYFQTLPSAFEILSFCMKGSPVELLAFKLEAINMNIIPASPSPIQMVVRNLKTSPNLDLFPHID